MDKVRVLLVLVTLGVMVGPLAGVLIVYRNNLVGMVIPSNLGSVTNGTLSSGEPLGPPQYVSSSYDNASRTFRLTFNYTNSFPLDLTISSMTADIQDTADGFPLGAASLASPVHMGAGETVDVTMVGNWTEGAISHFQTAHAGAKTIDVDLVDLTLDAGGINLGLKDRVTVPNVPLP